MPNSHACTAVAGGDRDIDFHPGRYKTQYKHFFQHPQNPEITASKGSQRVLRPRSARYRPSRLPWVQGGRPRAREPTFRIFTVANLG